MQFTIDGHTWQDLSHFGLDYETINYRIKELKGYCKFDMPYPFWEAVLVYIERAKAIGKHTGTTDDDRFYTQAAIDIYLDTMQF